MGAADAAPFESVFEIGLLSSLVLQVCSHDKGRYIMAFRVGFDVVDHLTPDACVSMAMGGDKEVDQEEYFAFVEAWIGGADGQGHQPFVVFGDKHGTP